MIAQTNNEKQNFNFEKSPLLMMAAEMMEQGLTFEQAINNAHNHFTKINYDMYSNNQRGRQIKEVIANRIWLKVRNA